MQGLGETIRYQKPISMRHQTPHRHGESRGPIDRHQELPGTTGMYMLLVANRSDIIRLVCEAMAEGGGKPTKQTSYEGLFVRPGRREEGSQKNRHHKACLQGQGRGRKGAKKIRHHKACLQGQGGGRKDAIKPNIIRLVCKARAEGGRKP